MIFCQQKIAELCKYLIHPLFIINFSDNVPSFIANAHQIGKILGGGVYMKIKIPHVK